MTKSTKTITPTTTGTKTGLSSTGSGSKTYVNSHLWKRNCHRSNAFVFEYKNVRFHASGTDSGASEVWGWLTINLLEAGSFGLDQFIAYQGFESPTLSKWAVPKAIHLPIKNFGVPYFPTQFWKDLLASLVSLAQTQENGLDVLIICQGGHGRTGMVLSILAGLAFGFQEPITWVRKNYCIHAVETNAQAQYVWEMLEVDNAHILDKLFPKPKAIVKKKGSDDEKAISPSGEASEKASEAGDTPLPREGGLDE